MPVDTMTVTELAERRAGDDTASRPLVLDVREDWERRIAALPEAVAVPMNDVPERVEEIRRLAGERDVVVFCHSGKRSLVIAGFLQQNGFARVFNLTGGIDAWSQQIDDSVHRY